MNRILPVALLVFFPLASLATDRVPSASHMRSYTAEYEFFVEHKDGSLARAGQWTDNLEIEEQRIVRTVTRKSLDGNVDLVRTVAADRLSLAPLHVTQRFGPGLSNLYHSQLHEGQFTQVLINDDAMPARIAAAQIPQDVLEVNLKGIFAAALPLDAG